MPSASHLSVVPDQPKIRQAADTAGAAIERALLGTAMQSPADLAAIRDLLPADAFTDPRHTALWHTITTADNNGHPTNALAITEQLITSGNITRMPTTTYPLDLIADAQPGQGAYWARQLADRHTRRSIAEHATRLSAAAANPGADLDTLTGLAEQVIAATTAAPTAAEPATLGGLLDDYLHTYDDYEAADGLPTPWPDLNDVLTAGGFERGQVVTFGGATSMGKSVAVTDCARHLGVHQQTPTVMFTLEMTEEQVMFRLTSALTGVPEKAIRLRQLAPRELAKVVAARETVHAAPLWIISGERNVTQIGNDLRRLRNRHGDVAVVVVDYAQIVKSEGRAENRQLEVSRTMQQFKRLALTENVLVVTASQVNRAPANRTDKRPTLADLRESGEIENSSDIVILIHREDYYDKESSRAGEADFIVAKQRGGPTDTITVASQLHLTRFASMAAL